MKKAWVLLHLAHNEDFCRKRLSLISLHCSYEKSLDPPFGAQRNLWTREDSVWSVYTVHMKKLRSFSIWRKTKTLVSRRHCLVSLHCSHEKKPWIFLHLAHNEDFGHKKIQSGQSSLFTRKSLDPSPFGAQRRLWSREDSVWSIFTAHTKKAWIIFLLAHNEDFGHKKTQSGQSSLFTRKKHVTFFN